MSILENICTTTGEPTPRERKDIPVLIRSVLKMDPALFWQSFSAETQEYLNACAKSVRLKKGIPMPPDLDLPEVTLEQKAETNPDKLSKKERRQLHQQETLEYPAEDSFIDDLPTEIDCRVQNEVYSIGYLVDELNKGDLTMPPCQRNLVWKPPVKELFLDSLFANIPGHNIFLVRDPGEDNSKNIIDGLQRLTTLRQYLGDEIDFLGRKFSGLPKALQNKFKAKKMAVTEIEASSKFWPVIFRRINRGGVPLTDIEVRRTAISHPLMVELEEIAKDNEEWITLFGRTERFQGLNSLLKAVAMHVGYREYQKPIARFLDGFCDSLHDEYAAAVDNQTKMDEISNQVQETSAHIDMILRAIREGCGKEAFKLPGKKALNQGLIDTLFHAGFMIISDNPTVKYERLKLWLAATREALVGNVNVTLAMSVDTSGRDKVMLRMKAAEDFITHLISSN